MQQSRINRLFPWLLAVALIPGCAAVTPWMRNDRSNSPTADPGGSAADQPAFRWTDSPRAKPVAWRPPVVATEPSPLLVRGVPQTSLPFDVLRGSGGLGHVLDLQFEQTPEIGGTFRQESADLAEVPFTFRLPPVSEQRFTYSDLCQEQWTGIRTDHAAFYSSGGLTWLAAGIGAGALMANSGFDEHFLRDAYVENIVFASSDEFYEKLHQPKFLGNGIYTIPVFALAALAEPLIDDLPLGSATAEWGQRSLRAILVGGPPMLGLQWLTGGGRPDETRESSEWRPFQDDNGVSGHSFMGAIPFLSAAKMTDNLWLKAGLYAASTLPAISRVNDDHHYFSQVFLGWWLAYLAECAVDRSHDPDTNHQFFVYPHPGGIGLGMEYRM